MPRFLADFPDRLPPFSRRIADLIVQCIIDDTAAASR
jgi:hypothetical protein